MAILTKSCDVCGVRNSAETPVEKDKSGKFACEKHKSEERAVFVNPSGDNTEALKVLETRVKKLESFIQENNELALQGKINELLDDRLKVMKFEDRLAALEAKGKKNG